MCISRFTELRAAHSTSAEEAARALLDVCARYGVPKRIRTDGGSQYANRLIRELTTLMGVQHTFSIAYVPQSNGLVEAGIRSTVQLLRALVNERHIADMWSTALPLVQRCLNTHVHSATGHEPASIVFGERADLSRQIFKAHDDSNGISSSSMHEYIRTHSRIQDHLIATARKHQSEVIERRLKLINKQTAVEYEPGQRVLVRFPADRPRGKLYPRARGPMLVVRKVGSNTYELEDTLDKTLSLHSSMNMRPWSDRFAKVNERYETWDLQEWEVDKLIDHRIKDEAKSKKRRAKTDYEFKVRWYGYSADDDSWRGYEHLKDTAALESYLEGQPRLKRFLDRGRQA